MIPQAGCWHFEEAAASGSIPDTWNVPTKAEPLGSCTLYNCTQCHFSASPAEARAHSKANNHLFFKNVTGHGVYCVRCDDLIYPPYTIQPLKKRHSEDEIEDDQAPPIKRVCKRHGLRGMYNLGQTCYLNSMIQAIIHNSLLASFFLGNGHPNYACELDDCLACALTEAFEASWTSEEAEPFAPTKMLISSWRNSVIDVGDRQHDSHEFYLGLLDKLHNRIHGGGSEHCRCFIHRAFYGSLRDTLICGSCKHSKTTRNPIADLALDIPVQVLTNGNSRNKRPLDLVTCLENFTAPEQLEGRVGMKENAAYSCSNCGAEGKATKRLEIKRLPPLLCIQFKRFRREKEDAKKIEEHVTFPLSIDMAPFTVQSHGHLMYDLESVVVHQSEAGKAEIEKGHYFTYSKRGQQWFLFNDDRVTVANIDDVLDAQAYVLFYRIRSMTQLKIEP